ncbi:MAG: S41 family peptidase [Candidatus Aminicenantales bacterium]
MKKRLVFTILILALAALAGPLSSAGRNGYYRFPALRGTTVVFTSEGDLWSVDIKGGTAVRLTSHPGLEMSPAISPDGTTVAFAAQYEGPTEVYTMPLAGGLPVRRTFSGQTSIPVGWTPDGKIIYATQKYSTLPNTELVILDPQTNAESLLPLSQAADGAFDPAGRTLFFTRLPFQGSYTKRYKGGTAQSLWKFTMGDPEAAPLTADYAGTSKNPMTWQGRVYFVSDRDGTMNLWSMDDGGKDLRQHTFHKGFDVSSPSLDNGRIAYQLVADLHIYDIAAGKDVRLDVTLPSDFDQMREKWITKPADYLTSAHLSPSGDRVALVSRGNVFVAPVGDGRWVRVSRKDGVRNRAARFLGDGKSLMVLSDETGEWDFHRFAADGLAAGEQLTTGARVIRFDGVPSPDGRSIAFADKDYQLWVWNGERKTLSKIAESGNGMFDDLAWSPDGRWLAFVRPADNGFQQIMVLNAAADQMTELTNDRVDSYNPVWSPDGKWLYFLSDRYFRSAVGGPWGPRQPEPYFDKTTKIYAMALTAKEIFPFAPANELNPDEKERKDVNEAKAASAPAGKTDKPAEAKGAKEAVPKVVIELAGIQDRVFEVPLAAGVYSQLVVGDKVLFLIDRESNAAGRGKLQAVEIKNRNVQVKTLIEDVRNFELSADGKKILVQKDSDLYVIDASTAAPAALGEKKVDLSRWTFSIDPRQEWRQMFTDAWRMERDYFYDRNLHNVDYQGLLERHKPFVERVSDRSELNDLLAHLVGELSALHTFVRGGDIRQGADSVAPGSLGARLVRDEAAGGYRVEHIYRSDPEYPERCSPLAKPMTDIHEGDVITSINGTATLGVADPSLLLRNTAGQQVLVEVKPAGGGGALKAIVYPITPGAESDLRYSEWEYTRRLEVDKAAKGDIGYVHLRAMGNDNYTEWVKNFYPVFDRKGLIIDVRHNRGGNIDSWILEKLMRRAWFYWQSRVGNPTWNMQYAFRGHMVVLCDEDTASDGEAFSEGFRRLGLGKVIGTRTWGGEIWLSSSNVLVDRGLASAAEMGVYGPEREWLIEGHGVDPDIVVDNLPHATFLGKDAQLEAAVKHLQELIKKQPVEVPKHPAYPDKRK